MKTVDRLDSGLPVDAAGVGQTLHVQHFSFFAWNDVMADAVLKIWRRMRKPIPSIDG